VNYHGPYLKIILSWIHPHQNISFTASLPHPHHPMTLLTTNNCSDDRWLLRRPTTPSPPPFSPLIVPPLFVADLPPSRIRRCLDLLCSFPNSYPSNLFSFPPNLILFFSSFLIWFWIVFSRSRLKYCWCSRFVFLLFFYYLEQQFTIPCMHAFVKDSQASVKMIVHASIFDCDAGIVAVGEEAEKRDARDFLLHIISGPNNRILCFEVYDMKTDTDRQTEHGHG